MIELYVCLYSLIAFPDQTTCIGVETSGRQARAGVCMSRLSRLFVLPMYRPRTAYIHGLEFCTGDFVIIMDADFSHHVRVFGIAVDTTLIFCGKFSPSLYLSLCGTSL